MKDLCVVVLAGGLGTRMRSATPKLLHPVAGRPLGVWTAEAALRLRPGRLVIVVGGGGRERLEAEAARRWPRAPIVFVLQREPLGTGHALRCGLRRVPRSARRVLVLYGDTPLVPVAILRRLLRRSHRGCPLVMATSVVDDPAAYGRVIRDGSGRVARIVEHRDAGPAERAVKEVNPGLYAFDAAFLRRAVRMVGRDNVQGEFYLTDLVEIAAGAGGVRDVPAPFGDLCGVNTREEMAAVEECILDRIRREWMRRGVTIRAPVTVRIEPDVRIGRDVEIAAGVQLLGGTRVGRGSRIGAGSILRDVVVGEGVEIPPYVAAAASRITAGAPLGPFTHLRPER